MYYEEIVRRIARDPGMQNLQELVIKLVKIVIEKNIGNLFSQNITGGIKKSLEEIRKIMREHNIPVPEENHDLYEKIVRPAYLEMIRRGR